MLQTRIVPWINYEEFETVYHWLFADRKTQSDTIQLGIDRVNKALKITVVVRVLKQTPLGSNMD